MFARSANYWNVPPAGWPKASQCMGKARTTQALG